MAPQLGAVANQAVPANNAGTPASPKLAKAAREFEAILLQGWLEKMNQSFAGLEKSQDPAHDTLSSLGTQAIAGALAARGGIGIGNMILHQLQARSSATDTSREPQPGIGAQPGSANGPGIAKSGFQTDRGKTLKVSHELPITKLQGNTWDEVPR